MKYFIILYNTFLWAMIIAFIMFKNVWLEMRVNVGLCFFIVWALFFIIFLFASSKKNIFKNFKIFSSINLILFLVITLIILSPKGAAYIPASIIRDGLHAAKLLNLNSINIILLVFILGGLILICSKKSIDKGNH
ncbi:hypothetical protein [Brachyspira murdochii]|uniref:YciC n=1 Tax=Brachyspira murdochii (strain ATCC 51284 / DSM 12563 / 56-150) TaxID=526224 RepID=D5U7F6_BRAM5|nr:hypothetical protein [Brachyspira murdochii]ADG70744.1 YciC [Brachyspira murdochii DSM 12563]